MKECKRKPYSTSISAKKAIADAGGRPKQRDVEKCSDCGKWHVKAGTL